MKRATKSKRHSAGAAKRRSLDGQVRPRPSNKPQNVNADCWWYENRGSIELIAWVNNTDGTRRTCVNIRIPWKKLMESARRCRPEECRSNGRGEL